VEALVIFMHFTLRLQGRLVAAAVVLVMATAVAWAHSGPGVDHMQMQDVVAVCLAIEGTAVAALLGFAAPRLGRFRGPPVVELALGHQRCHAVPVVRARDGPALLQVFRI
jgi:hypothetical protein